MIFKKRKGEEAAEEGIAIGMNWFAGATMLNFGVGSWYWEAVPEYVRSLGRGWAVPFSVFSLSLVLLRRFFLLYME